VGACPEHCGQREEAVELGWILEMSSPERNDGFMSAGLGSGGAVRNDFYRFDQASISISRNPSVINTHEE
jgi:hypothetical protein